MAEKLSFVNTIFKFAGLGQYNPVPPTARAGESLQLQTDANGRLKIVDESIGIHSQWTPPAAAASSGVVLEGPNRISSLLITNAGGSTRWVWIYDGVEEKIAAVAVAAGATEQVLFGSGIGVMTVTDLNFKASSSAETFTADGAAKIRIQANYYIDPASQVDPAITSISPASFVLAGGPTTISGVNFVTGAAVLMDGAIASGATVVSPTQITWDVPAHVAGSVSVRVQNPDGTQSNAVSIVFSAAGAPTLSSVSPNPVATTGGTCIATGTGFVAGAVVKVAGVSCTVNSVTSTTISFEAPAKSAGSYTVEIINPDASTTTPISNAITYAAVFDPASLPLTVWLRGGAYNAGTGVWTGRASAGSSGSLNASNVVSGVPTDGATLNGIKSVHFNESQLQLSANDAPFGKNEQTRVYLLKSPSVSTDNSTVHYGREVVCAIAAGGGSYDTLSSDGNLDASSYDGSFPRTNTTYTINAWNIVFVQIKTISGTTKIRARTGKGSWTAGSTITIPLSTGAGVYALGGSGSSASLSNTDIMEVIASDTALSDANCDNIVDYVNARYGLALS